jgi:hypothetical protein
MKYLAILLLAITTISAFSQGYNNDSSASCVAYWKKGQNKKLSIFHIKESYEQGKLKSTFNFEYEADVVVVDVSASGYTMQWTFHLPELVKQANPALADSLPVFEGMKMIYKTSETGAFTELVNWQEVKDAYIKMMEISLPKNLDSAGRAAVNQSKELFNSREMVETSLIREIQLFHVPYGSRFSKTETKVESQLPNPFAEESLPAILTYRISEINPKQDYFKLIIDQKIDPKGAEKLFESLFRRMNIANDTAIIEAKKLLEKIEISDNSEYQFILSTGWLRKLSQRRTVKNAGMAQMDAYLIELKE